METTAPPSVVTTTGGSLTCAAEAFLAGGQVNGTLPDPFGFLPPSKPEHQDQQKEPVDADNEDDDADGDGDEDGDDFGKGMRIYLRKMGRVTRNPTVTMARRLQAEMREEGRKR
ncbi:nucleolin [Iris pallida]|uniref:Nucleolin n=1 Tax=Iris pallida TaxID=29817 RepID=A0AAX6HS72_IRIPA|nr:nucleolin [Iris pallida]